MKILFLSRWFPYPVNNGSKLRIYNLLRELAKNHQVDLVSFADQPGLNIQVPEIQEICTTVDVIPWREFNPNTISGRLALLSLAPRSIVDTFSSEMANTIKHKLEKKSYDIVIASQLQMAAYYSYFQNTPAIFEEVEIGLFHDQMFSVDGKMRIRLALTWLKLYLYLSRLFKSFQACTVASKNEYQLLAKYFPKSLRQVEVIPNCLNMDEYESISVVRRQNTLIFTGSFKYHVNYDAMNWFVRDVFPLILEKIPDTQLVITGDHANLSLPSMENITLTGHVDDIRSLIASCSISIAPLLSGGGTRLKILEAMALGTPVVATSKGAEGLDVVNREHLLMANTSVGFAECIVNLLQNPDLCEQLANNALALVKEKYDWGVVIQEYLSLINTVAH